MALFVYEWVLLTDVIWLRVIGKISYWRGDPHVLDDDVHNTIIDDPKALPFLSFHLHSFRSKVSSQTFFAFPTIHCANFPGFSTIIIKTFELNGNPIHKISKFATNTNNDGGNEWILYFLLYLHLNTFFLNEWMEMCFFLIVFL